MKRLCHRCYRQTHFVEVCGTNCPKCAAEGLPRILTNRPVEAKDMIGDLFRGAGLAVVAGVIALVVLLLLGSMYLFGFGLFSKATADFRGSVSQTNKVRANGDYRIAAYEHFYDLCAAVQTSETRIERFADDLAGDKRGTQQWYLDRANLDAASLNRADLINTYNADARKADTQGHFLASDLPYQLDQGTENTTCTA